MKEITVFLIFRGLFPEGNKIDCLRHNKSKDARQIMSVEIGILKR